MIDDGTRPALFRRIAREEWEASRLADTPALPWIAEDGRKVGGFVLVPIPECPMGTTVVFLDRDGEPLQSRNEGAMVEMVRRLRPRLAEVTKLPE